MSFGAVVLGLVAIVVVAPLLIIGHYVTRWRESRTLSTESERMLIELSEVAARLTDRVTHLERILDAEAPNWRTPR